MMAEFSSTCGMIFAHVFFQIQIKLEKFQEKEMVNLCILQSLQK